MNSRPVITVDGLAASGKSSIARELALKLGFVHLSTGLLYRAVGALAIRAGVSSDDEVALERLAQQHRLELSTNARGASVVAIDGVVAGDELGREEVSKAASAVARFPAVRTALFG